MINLILEILKIAFQALDLLADVFRRLPRRRDKTQPIEQLVERARRGKCLSQNESAHIRGEVLEVYRIAGLLLNTVRSKCVYVAMYLYLIYARLVGGFECKAALERVRKRIPKGCLDNKDDDECILAKYLLTNKATKKMRELAGYENIYGKMAKYMLGGVFPDECVEDLRELIEKMPETHRHLLNIPPLREEEEGPRDQAVQLAEASRAEKGS